MAKGPQGILNLPLHLLLQQRGALSLVSFQMERLKCHSYLV